MLCTTRTRQFLYTPKISLIQNITYSLNLMILHEDPLLNNLGTSSNADGISVYADVYMMVYADGIYEPYR